MSEFINNPQQRKELLKHMILQLHQGEAPGLVRKRLVEILREIPYNEVVEVEQQLIAEGLPEEEVLKFCDIHHMVLDGHIDQTGAKEVPAAHPVDTFRKENRELGKVAADLMTLFGNAQTLSAESTVGWFIAAHAKFNALMDVDKHYLRKEYLLFPFLEKNHITGPPKVMWGKHDEIRALLKSAIEAVSSREPMTPDELAILVDLGLKPAVQGVLDMILKEEQILLPMCMDTLTDSDWYQIYQQTPEYGFCLYDPQEEWKPANITTTDIEYGDKSIRLPTGSFNPEELAAMLSSLPVDLTFVDKDDKVKFFSHGPNRIFARNRAILGRDVRMCHPPGSVHVVDQILTDFKSGEQNSAAFWINFGGRFIYIEYFAVRSKDGEYLGTVEFTQDLTKLRQLEGEQRLLSYSANK
ncbi:MAG: DUF438 domain-containing protein [Breznakibacter sp.]